LSAPAGAYWRHQYSSRPAFEAGMSSPGNPVEVPSPRLIAARVERLHVWSLSPAFIAIIGLGFLFTFYDIFDINVSFIQTCVQIHPGCTPETALGALPLPVV